MDLQALKNIVAAGEDSVHQFKEDIRNQESLAAEMVAFSNASGGIILIGVANNGDLVGVSSHDVDRINQLVSNAASQAVRSPIIVRTENVLLSNQRIVIALFIDEGIDKPYFDNQGVIWLKNGADKRRLNSKEELRRIFQSVDSVHADEVPTRFGLDVLNMPYLYDFFKRVYHMTLPVREEDRLRLLENMNVVRDGHVNLAGLLLFGGNPQMYKPQFTIKAAKFIGTTIANRYDDSEDFDGPLTIVFDKALNFIMRNLHKLQNQKSVNSVGDPEVPQIVFEEILVNALMHRDYFISAPIRLFVFDDRIEIISPGSLPNHLSVEKIRLGSAVQRNPIIASFASKGLLPYRGLGTGVMRALKEWPTLTFIDDREACTFTVVIRRPQKPS